MKKTIWLFLYLFCLLFVTYGQTVTSLKKTPIIDMHLHAVWWGEPLLIGPLGLKAPKDPAAMRDSTFFYLKKFNIVRAVTDDAFALDYFRQDPQRIIPARQGISPLLRDSVDSLRQWFSAGTYKLMAEFCLNTSGSVLMTRKWNHIFRLLMN